MHEAESTTTLKRDALGRITVTKEQREALVDAFERSALKGTQFARIAGINYQTFAAWVQARRHVRGEYAQRPTTKLKPKVSSGRLRLVEAVVTASPAGQAPGFGVPAESNSALEVVLPGGVRVFVASTQQATLAVQLIQALRASC